MRSLQQILIATTVVINVVHSNTGIPRTDHELIRSLPSVQIPSFDYGHLMDDETPQNMLLALERDGILALRNIPNYQRIRDAYFEIATKCVLEAKPEDSQSFVSSKTFGDGTQRATISSEAGLNLNSAGLLRALGIAIALEKSSFEIYDQDQLISIREMINEATRLDHFHLYDGTENEVEANPTSNHAHRLSSEELSVSLHEDRGLFIVMASPQFSRASKQGRLNSMQVEPDDRGLIISKGMANSSDQFCMMRR
ncbi:unnamed protein product [Albugo candida]|uniref:Uncharacterized protein n=1 Tax=Albugo candida TaxID=65357 RepID=A0A024GNS5_9STRA|nr:unnamed protein product [Albugo candida]|eukprot:CCI47992.1 unnamed protein product [Albugo candida]